MRHVELFSCVQEMYGKLDSLFTVTLQLGLFGR